MSPTAHLRQVLGVWNDVDDLKKPGSTETNFYNQWQNPKDILSLLLILGPDVIWRALAQMSGQRVTPVVFSFGWVAYTANALVAALGGALPAAQPGREKFGKELETKKAERWPPHARPGLQRDSSRGQKWTCQIILGSSAGFCATLNTPCKRSAAR